MNETAGDEIEFAYEDVLQLLRQNPLAAEQLKVIALRRMYLRAHRELQALKEGTTGDRQVMPMSTKSREPSPPP